MSAPPLILASTSPYRAAQLRQLGLDFETVPPGADETPRPGETPEALAGRLADAKATAVARRRPEAVVIGSDQCAALGPRILGKPGDFDTAREQLRAASGNTVVFHTGVCVRRGDSGFHRTMVVPFAATFRELSDDRIARYLEHDRPYDCAGSIRTEGLGPALLERTEGDDPTAVTGLPLIHTVRLLEAAGRPVL
ncbi:septum formation inhibitor Maf [Thiohalorhabdus denitrificans]|uniref:7-methyl-GTP pyrophosphatase n=1 Tax=Thiohalorhabdus denitrificans TaxID=381306 RepID=A0A0P9CNA8_9GAMM|nr:nucleoside triphosphate pyrophosphatase [Thiohalorhabdus denitrificans]KPV40582.1 septum formation inhibitor Maf [Thiohalorhabdus denitrificans]SCY50537.1 septum formation protein [Thiohalorhabdus denitrificans]